MAVTGAERLFARLGAARSWHALRDIKDRTAIRYYAGQSQRQMSGDATAKAPVVTRSKPFMPPNFVAPIIWHCMSLSAVNNWDTLWKAIDSTNPDAHLTARQKSMWTQSWLPTSNIDGIYYQERLLAWITGCGLATWYHDEKAPGGVRLERIWSHRITTDPGVVDQELESHPYVIDSQVIPVSLAKHLLSRYLSPDDPIFKTGLTMNAALSGEAWLGRYLFQLQPGIGMSVEPAIIMHREFNDGFRSVSYYLENNAPLEDGTKQFKTVVEDMDWHWGNPIWKLDGLPSPVCSHGDGLVTHLIPPTDLFGFVCAHKLWTEFSRASLIWLVHKDSVEDDSPLTSGVENAKVYMKTRDGRAPEALQMPKYDGSLDGQEKSAMGAYRIISGIFGALSGDDVRSDQAASTLEFQGQQGRATIGMITDGWRKRTERFFNNMASAGVDHLAMTNSKKFISVVGYRNAEKSLDKVLKGEKTALLGPTACSLKQSAWLPDTPAEVHQKIMGWITAGRIKPGDATNWEYLLTGRETYPGQETTFANAWEMVRRIRDGEDVDVPSTTNLDIYVFVIEQTLDGSLINDLPQDFIKALEFQKNRLSTQKLLANQQTGLQQQALGPAQEPPESQEQPGQQPQMATTAAA